MKSLFSVRAAGGAWRLLAGLGLAVAGFDVALAADTTVVVGEFTPQEIERNDAATAATLSAAVQAGLGSGSEWKFVDRQETDRLLNELALGQRGITAAGTSLRAGQLLKADLVLTGTIFTPEKGKPFMILETTELARAEPVAQRRIELGTVLDQGHLTMPSGADLQRITQAGAQLLTETQAKLAAQAGRTVIKPLFFVNESDGQRLDGSERVLTAALTAAVEKEGRHRLLTSDRSETAAGESEMVLLGLVQTDLAAWAQVADYYLWGSYREQNSAGRDLPEVDLAVSATIWDGRHAPVELSETGKVRELPVLADRLARKILAETGTVSRGTDANLGLEQRKKISAMLADRALKLRDTETATDQVALPVRHAARYREQRRLLAAALFFSPTEKAYWTRFRELRATRPAADTFSAELRERVDDFYGRLQFLDRFLVGPDGKIDASLTTWNLARPSQQIEATIPAEAARFYDPQPKWNIGRVEQQLGAAGRAWVIRTSQNLVATSPGQEEAFLPVASALLSEALNAPFSPEEREGLVGRLWPRMKVGAFAYRAWYPGGALWTDSGTGLVHVLEQLRDYYVETGQPEKVLAMERLTAAELAAAEQLPPPTSSPAAEARNQVKTIVQMVEFSRAQLAKSADGPSRDFQAERVKDYVNQVKQGWVRIEAMHRRALAFLRTHGPAGLAAANDPALLEGEPSLEARPKEISPGGLHWQAKWLRETAQQRETEGYPATVLNRMRTRADELDRAAELALNQKAAAASTAPSPPTQVPGTSPAGAAAVLIFNPLAHESKAALDDPFRSKLPRKFAQLPTIPLPAVAWELHDRNQPYWQSNGQDLWVISKIIPWKDDVWLLARGHLWRHRPYDGAVDDLGRMLGVGSSVLSLLRTDDAIWIGTMSEGVWRVDPDTLAVRRYGLKDGLQSVRAAQLAVADHFLYAVEQPKAEQLLFQGQDWWLLGPGERKAVISRLDLSTGKWTAFDPFAKTPTRGLKVGVDYEGIGSELFLLQNRVLDPETGEIRQLPIDFAQLFKFINRNPTAPQELHTELVEGDTLWLGFGSTLLNFNLESGVTSPPMEAPAFTGVVTDGHYLFCLRPDDVHARESTNVEEPPAELFVFDRVKSAWIGRAELQGRVKTMAVGSGRLWLGRENHPRTLLEVDLAQLIRAFAAASDAGAVVLEKGQPPATVTASPATATTSLFVAAWRGDTATMKTLLDHGANPNWFTPTGWTPLHSAVRGGSPEAVELLLARGAKLDVTDLRGWYPLRIAFERNDRVLFDALVKSGHVTAATPGLTQPPVPNTARTAAQEFWPPLETLPQLAAKSGNAITVEQLLGSRAAAGAKTTPKTAFAGGEAESPPRPLPRLSPAEQRNPELLQTAVAYFDPRQAQFQFGTYAKNGDLPSLKELLARGAPVEAAGLAIAAALDTEQWPAVAYLLAQGYHARDPWPNTDPIFASAASADRESLHPAVMILTSALLAGREDLAKQLLQEGIVYPPSSRTGASAARRLVYEHRVAALELALRAHASVRGGWIDSRTPLYVAIRTHDLPLLRLLLAAGADPTEELSRRAEVRLTVPATFKAPALPRGINAFGLCGVENWPEGLALLLAQPNLDLQESFNLHPYELATLPAVRAALYRAELAQGRPGQASAQNDVLVAIVAHDEPAVAAAVKAGSNLDGRGTRGETALMLAAIEKAPKLARLLMDGGASLTDLDGIGSTPLAYAARSGDIELVREMVRRGGSLELARGDAGRPLDQAIEVRDVSMALGLLELGASPKPHPIAHGETTPLFRALTRNLPDVVREILRRGENPRQISSNGESAFVAAARSNNPALIQLFVDLGADLNRKTAKGWTPMMTAVRWGAVNSVRKLSEAGLRDPAAADLAVRLVKDENPPDRPDDAALRSLPYVPDYLGSLEYLQSSGQVAGSRQAQDTLFWAQPHSEAEIVAYLMKGGTVNYRGERTPLQAACETGDEGRVKFLLGKGADPNLLGFGEYRHPIWLALNYPAAVELLLRGGANPNWLTPISFWANGGGSDSILATAVDQPTPSVASIRLLVKYGADPRLTLGFSLNAWDTLRAVARRPEHPANLDQVEAALSGR